MFNYIELLIILNKENILIISIYSKSVPQNENDNKRIYITGEILHLNDAININ